MWNKQNKTSIILLKVNLHPKIMILCKGAIGKESTTIQENQMTRPTEGSTQQKVFRISFEKDVISPLDNTRLHVSLVVGYLEYLHL